MNSSLCQRVIGTSHYSQSARDCPRDVGGTASWGAGGSKESASEGRGTERKIGNDRDKGNGRCAEMRREKEGNEAKEGGGCWRG